MPETLAQGPAGPAGDEGRVDGETARRILQRAAAEQQRLTSALADTYTLTELKEIAAEAGISTEALNAAVEADRANSQAAAERTARQANKRGLLPGRWSRGVKALVLTAAGGVVAFGSLLAFPEIAGAVFWALLLVLILVSVLLILGASPF